MSNLQLVLYVLMAIAAAVMAIASIIRYEVNKVDDKAHLIESYQEDMEMFKTATKVVKGSFYLFLSLLGMLLVTYIS